VKRFEKDYPREEALSAINVTLATTGGAATVEQHVQGFRRKSIDQADIVLALLDGTAAARVAPYPGWEYLRERAERAWAEWRRTVAYSDLKRIGIRYVNRIDIPIPQSEGVDIDSYLRFTPRVPDFSRHPIDGFVVQVTKPTEVEHWNVSITSSIVNPLPLVNHLSISLDMDIFRTEQIPGRQEDLWNCIDAVRPLKNAIFEACITDEARKLFA
jgi:uncharacterized protein (TIGR04255 family)